MKKNQIKKAKALQELTAKWYGVPKVKGSQKDYITVNNDFCNGEYSKAKKTRLYNNYGGEYCSLLEVLANKYRDHQSLKD